MRAAAMPANTAAPNHCDTAKVRRSDDSMPNEQSTQQTAASDLGCAVTTCRRISSLPSNPRPSLLSTACVTASRQRFLPAHALHLLQTTWQRSEPSQTAATSPIPNANAIGGFEEIVTLLDWNLARQSGRESRSTVRICQARCAAAAPSPA